MNFNQNDEKVRQSQTMIVIEYELGEPWFKSVRIYPSVFATDYSIRYDFKRLDEPVGLNGGVCGLTKLFHFGNEFWHREDRSDKIVNYRPTATSSSGVHVLSEEFGKFWE